MTSLREIVPQPLLKPGCYNTPEFLAYEREHPQEAVMKYAQHAAQTGSDREYDFHARKTIARFVGEITGRAKIHELQGKCHQVSVFLMRALEKAEIWCFLAHGTAIVEFPGTALKRETLQVFDLPQSEHSLPGHTWVVAPPFFVVDVTLRTQPYRNRACAKRIPSAILGDGTSSKIVRPNPRELVGDGGSLEGAGVETVEWVNRIHAESAPAVEFSAPHLRVRYIPVSLKVLEGDFDDWDDGTLGGISYAQFYQRI